MFKLFKQLNSLIRTLTCTERLNTQRIYMPANRKYIHWQFEISFAKFSIDILKNEVSCRIRFGWIIGKEIIRKSFAQLYKNDILRIFQFVS